MPGYLPVVSFRSRVDGGTVVAAGGAVRKVGGGLDGAPAGAALRTVGAALPGGVLAGAAGEQAEGDRFVNIAHFGDDPSSLNGVTMLSSAREIIDGEERSRSRGHSAYLHDGTTSQYDIAAVVAGVPGRAVRARPAPPPEWESVHVPMGP